MKLILGTLFFGLFTWGMIAFWRITFRESRCPWCRGWMVQLMEYRCGCAQFVCRECGVEFYNQPCCGDHCGDLEERLDKEATGRTEAGGEVLKHANSNPPRPPRFNREGEW